MKSESDLEKRFSRKAVALPLIRRGYAIREQVSIGDFTVDLLAEGVKDGRHEQFGVQVHYTPARPKTSNIQLFQETTTLLSRQLGISIYLALVFNSGKDMIVDQFLKKRMMYSRKDMSVDAIQTVVTSEVLKFTSV